MGADARQMFEGGLNFVISREMWLSEAACPTPEAANPSSSRSYYNALVVLWFLYSGTRSQEPAGEMSTTSRWSNFAEEKKKDILVHVALRGGEISARAVITGYKCHLTAGLAHHTVHR